MNILYINPTSDLYGASRSLLRLMTALDKSIYKPLVILPEEGVLARELRQQQIPVLIISNLAIIRRQVFSSWRIVLFMFSILPSILQLWWIVKKYKVDVVHSNTGVVFTPAFAAKLTGVPHVWHVREMFADEFGSLWQYYQKFMVLFSNRIICVSSPIAQQFPPSQKVVVIHNGFDINEFKVHPSEVDHWRQKFCCSDDTKLIGVVGRISPRKGQDVFVQACNLLRDWGYHDDKYLIVGDAFSGNEYLLKELHAFIEDHNLEERIILTGFIKDPKPLIAALDILVLPSILPEAFPGVVLEGMALGVPVIGTAIGGTTEQIDEGESGFLIPPHNYIALAEAIKILLDNSDLRKRMGLLGKARLQKNFNLDNMRIEIESIYREVNTKLSSV